MKRTHDEPIEETHETRTQTLRLRIPEEIVKLKHNTNHEYEIDIEVPMSDVIGLPTDEMYKAIKDSYTPQQSERLVGAMLDAFDKEQAMIYFARFIK